MSKSQGYMSKSLNSSLFQELLKVYSLLSTRRQWQLVSLLGLMLLTAVSEAFSIGALIPFLSALTNAQELLTDSSLSPFLDALSISTASELAILLSVTFIFCILIANSLRVITVHCQTNLAAMIANDLSCRVYKHTLLQPYDFHVKRNSSDLISSVTEDTRNLTLRILLPVLTFLTNSVIALTLISALLFIDGRIAVISALTLGTAYMFLYSVRRRLLNRNSSIIVESSRNQIRTVQEGIGGIREVILGGEYPFYLSAYKSADVSYRKAQASNLIVAQTPRYLIEGVAIISMALLALTLGNNGDFSDAVPVIGSLALGANRLLPAMRNVFTSVVKVQSARASLQRIIVSLTRPIDLSLLESYGGGEERLNVGFPSPDIQLVDVWFRYNSQEDWVLRDMSLKIPARSTVAFVGTTGSGKSTTADLILGLLRPSQGEILVADRELEGDFLREWQRNIAHVPQSIYLTDATIGENIAFGVSKQLIDWNRVYEAAKLARVDDFIRSLPAGYETYVGERGVRLSGGQRQRIGIARALYRQASVIVFDEATSALDNATEREVMDAIHNLKNKVTLILIAHRLSTVKRCDIIFNLLQGQVSEYGTYEELIRQSSSFQHLVTANQQS